MYGEEGRLIQMNVIYGVLQIEVLDRFVSESIYIKLDLGSTNRTIAAVEPNLATSTAF